MPYAYCFYCQKELEEGCKVIKKPEEKYGKEVCNNCYKHYMRLMNSPANKLMEEFNNNLADKIKKWF